MSYGSYDDRATQITYTGTWANQDSPSSTEGHIKYSAAANASAELTFVGSSITWIGWKKNTAGIARVYIDGTLTATVDNYSAAQQISVPVYTLSGLTNATHTITVVGTGTKNPDSTSSAVHIDGFVVGAPSAGTYENTSEWMAYTGSWTALNSGGSSGGSIHYSSASNAAVSLDFEGPTVSWYTWKASSGGSQKIYIDDVLTATFNSQISGSSQTRVLAFTARNLGPGKHTIKVTSPDSGTLHHDSFVVGRETPAPAESTAALISRLTTVPPTTTFVANAAQLTSALANAAPGAVIELAPSTTFTGQFSLEASGTTTQPIWITGPRSAVLQTGDVNTNAALRVTGAQHVRLNGFSVTNSLQGVMVKGAKDVSVANLRVYSVGYEAVHLYGKTYDSYAVGNLIEDTGMTKVTTGEGIYIGTSDTRWGEVTGGEPDTSNGNTVVGNTINRAGAESIEAKVGTSNGIIRDNVLDGHAAGSTANAMILIGGSGWKVESNRMTNARQYLLSIIEEPVENALGNSFRANTGNVPGNDNTLGFRIVRQPGSTLQAEVSCDNDFTGGANFVFANVFCTP